ncbi:HAD family hydrolase [Pontibacillus chungwhensis BH030062]|uniref:HAD family hydrolase n=1 Tax=Pontibacillus chungwhensis BH030062 TaxID=1385513 RepID=A0A0A2UXJ3_9BACI|nr:HAD-IIB family hydrolase [Pontibacillus chungwhensis]KGP91236.1 HAD family hydrolase [Pontibacillus chungwhensis BH030062]
MDANKITKFKQVKDVRNPSTIVFFDFDETYYPHELNPHRYDKLRELENYLLNQSEEGKLVFGWVTGSSVESAMDKMETGGLSLLPHFIASSLGTEITYFHENSFNKKDREWKGFLDQTIFSPALVDRIVKSLEEEHSIFLKAQTNLGDAPYKKNFYYQEESSSVDEINLDTIRKNAYHNGIAVNINKCNPLAGDPEDSYDIDFIPLGTGKEEIVAFMLRKYQVNKANAFAFGDSGNDLRMLHAVGNGFLVANATEEAKSKYSKQSLGSYSEGILHTLRSLN